MPPRTNSDNSDDDTSVVNGLCCGCQESLSIHNENGNVDNMTAASPSLLPLPAPPAPPSPIPTKPQEYKSFFEEWSKGIQQYIQTILVPQLIDTIVTKEIISTFVKSITAVQTAMKVQTDAEQILDDLQKKNASPDIIKEAQQNVNDAKSSVQTVTETCQSIASQTILEPLDMTFLSSSNNNELFDDTIYILYIVLHPTNLSKLVAWCTGGGTNNESKFQQVITTLLKPNVPLLRKMMESGGPINGQYGRAIKIYYDIIPHYEKQLLNYTNSNSINKYYKSDDVIALLQRLQLAVALEHAEPIAYFGTPSQFVNPIQRYKQYCNAFFINELDDHFITFNIWELRQIINSDATENELIWGRQCLMSYRPDIVLMDTDPLWNYNLIVRTDVNYTNPDWYKSPRSYDQILSGGGKCGPRAWYGRFICKAFGIPTWGVRQPGHAAMTRWTSKNNGTWDVCLGGGMWKSWWDDQGGLDFVLESQARSACTTELVFYQKVYRLQWLAQYYYKEKSDTVRRNGQYDPKNPWLTLGMIQRQRLVCNSTTTATKVHVMSKSGMNQLQRSATLSSGVRHDNTTLGEIVISATSCLPNDKGMIVPSFLGGKQLFVKDDAELVYQIDSSLFGATVVSPMTYNISCMVATAHRSEKNIAVTVNNGKNTSTYIISMPYTMGLWGETKPVGIIIDNVTSPKVVLRFKRPKQNFGFAFAEFKLSPIRIEEGKK